MVMDSPDGPWQLEQDHSRSTRSTGRFSLWVALALVVLLVGHRIAIGAGFGWDFGDDVSADVATVASGIVEFPEDNFAYLAFAEQSRNYEKRLANPFAISEAERVYVNPLFLVLGRMARLTGISTSGMLVLGGLLAAFAVVLLTPRIAKRLGVGAASQRCACVLIAFGSGLSAITTAVAPRGLDLAGVDRTHQDTIGISTFAVYPFQAITLAVLAFTVWFALRCLGAGARRGDHFALASFAFTSAMIRPYECALLAASLCIHAVLGSRIGRRHRVAAAATVSLAILPVLGYAFWITQHETWSDYAATTAGTMQTSRLAWIIGYGLFLPFAILGSIGRVRRDPMFDHRRLFTIWIALLALIVIGLNLEQIKLASGAQIPLAVLAGHGCARLWRHLTEGERPILRSLALRAAAIAVVCVGFFATTAHLFINVYRPHHVETELVTIARKIRSHGIRSPRVLADRDDGWALPGMVACRTYVGHWSMTPDRIERTRRLPAAGIAFAPPAETKVTQAAFDALLEDAKPDFIIMPSRSKATGFADLGGWEPLVTGAKRVLYGKPRRTKQRER